MRLSLRTKFVIVFAIIVAFPLITISIYNYYSIKERQELFLQERLVVASGDVSNVLIYYIKSAVQKSDLAAELVRDIVVLQRDDVQNFLYVKQDIWENSIVEIYDSNRKLLGRSYDGEIGTSSFFVRNNDEILEQTLRLGKIADYFVTPSGLCVRASTPIIAPHDLSCLGAVVVTYPFTSQLLYKIKSITKNDHFLYVIGPGIVHSTAGSVVNGVDFFDHDITTHDDSSFGQKNQVDNAVFQSIFRLIRNNDGQKVGYISASINRDHVDQEIRSAVDKVCIEFFLSLSGTILVTFFSTKYLTRPIYFLNEAISGMTIENTFREVVVGQNDEIGDLARSFNNMVCELKKKQDDLSRTERKYRNFFINSVEGIMQIGIDYRVIDCNISAARMFGYEDVQSLVAAVRDVNACLFPDSDAGKSFFAMVKRKGKVQVHEIEMVRRDGSRFTALVSMHMTREADRAAAVFEGSIADISVRKEKESAERARDAAQRANEFKSLFLANMSHEIRTPLNAIIGMSGVLQKTDLAGKQEEYVRVIDTASRNLLHLVNEILDFSKIESGEMRMELGEFDLEEMLDEILSLFVAQAARKDIEILADIGEGVPRILHSDQFRLRQVLINLCSNAFKFTENGEIVILVGVRERVDGIDVLEFEISDTGIGIPVDKRACLFDAFQQADSSTTRRYGGTGLGLTICKKLVEMLGGEIWIDPDRHVGSSFRFTIPSKVVEQVPDAGDCSMLQGVRVALVSGNARLLDILSRLVSAFGCSVTAAGGCRDFPGLCERPGLCDHDVVIVDGALDNDETRSFLMAYGECRGARARAVVLLPYNAPADEGCLGGHGRVEFLNKPVRRRALMKRMLELLGAEVPVSVEKRGIPQMDWMSGKKILLVEDNEFNQMVVLEVLDGYGPGVTVADNGKVAVDLLAGGHAFDLVFMDVQMPIMDGFEATEIIRKELGMTDLPIVAMTAHATTQDRDRCLARGMDAYLSKPIDRHKLEEVLKRYLDS